MRRAAVILLVALPLGACPPDLDRFRIEGEGGDGDSDGDGDGDGGEGEGEGEHTGGPCAVPHLLVGLEDLRGGHGRVLRFELGDDLPLRRCGDLTANAQMIGQPFAVAWVDEHRVAVATTDTVQMIDPADDSLTWTAAHSGLWPNDAFRIEAPEGRRLAIAYSGFGLSDDIRNVRTYDGAGGVATDWITNGGDLPIGLGVYSMTQSPVHHDRLLVLKASTYSAAEVDPFAAVAYLDPPFANLRDGVSLDSIYATEDAQNRVAWVGHDDQGSHVYYVLDSTGGPGLGVSLPLDCEGSACTFIHAVPDPSLNTRLIAMCEDDGDYATRRIVRFRSTADECETIFEAGSLPDPSDVRMSRMSVAWETP